MGIVAYLTVIALPINGVFLLVHVTEGSEVNEFRVKLPQSEGDLQLSSTPLAEQAAA